MSIVKYEDPTFLQVLVRNIQIMTSKTSPPSQISEANKFFVKVLTEGSIPMQVIFQLIQPSRSPDFHHYGLRILEANVKRNWKRNYSPDHKRKIWQLLLKYGCQVGPNQNFVKEKYASVVTYILLRDWPDPSPQIFGSLVTELLNSKRTDICLRVLNSFCQDLANEYSIDVNVKRQKKIRGEFVKTMCPKILQFYVQNIKNRVCVIQTVINIQNFCFICQEEQILQFAPLVYQVLKNSRSPAEKAIAVSCMNRLSERIEGQSNVFLANVVMKANPTDFHEREMLFHIMNHLVKKKTTVRSLDPIKFFEYFQKFCTIPRKYLSEKQAKDIINIILNFLKSLYGVAKSTETLENERKMGLRSQLVNFKKNKNRKKRNRKGGEIKNRKNARPIPHKILEGLIPVFQTLMALAVCPGPNQPAPGGVRVSLRLFYDWILLHSEVPSSLKEKIYMFMWSQMFYFQKLPSVHQFRVVCLLFKWGRKNYPFDVKVRNVDKYNSLLKQIVSYITSPEQIRIVEEQEKARQFQIIQKRKQQSNIINSTHAIMEEVLSVRNESLPGPYVNFIRLLRHFDSCYTSNPNSLRVVIMELFKVLFRLQYLSLKNVILEEWLEFCRSYPQIMFRFFKDLMGIQQRMIKNETNPQQQKNQQNQPPPQQGNNQLVPVNNNNNQLMLIPENNSNSPNIRRPGTFSLDEIMKYMEGCVIVADRSPDEQQKLNFLSFLLERPIQMFIDQRNRAKISDCNEILKSLMAKGDQEDIVRSLVLFTAVCKRIRNTKVISSKYFVKLLPTLLKLTKTLHTIYHPRYIQTIPRNVYMTIVCHQANTDRIPKNQLFRRMKKSVYFILGYCAEFVPEFWSMNQNLVGELSSSIFHNFEHLNICDLNKLLKSFLIPFVKHIPKTSFPMLQKVLSPILLNSLKSISERLKNRERFETPPNSSLGMKQLSNDQETWYDQHESKLYHHVGRILQLFNEDVALRQFLKRSDPLYMGFCEITLHLLYKSATLKFFYIYKEFYSQTLGEFYKNQRFEAMIAFHLLKGLIYQLTMSIDVVNQNELLDLITLIFVLYSPISKYPNYIFAVINKTGLGVLKNHLKSHKMLFKGRKKKVKSFLKQITGKKVQLNLNIDQANQYHHQRQQQQRPNPQQY